MIPQMVYLKLEKTDFEVLGFLIEDLNKDFSIKEIADTLRRPYVKVHSSIKRLKDKKIVKEEVKGKSHYCSVDYKNNIEVVCFVSSLRAKEFLGKNKQVKLIIENIIEGIKSPDYILLLFGSFAKGVAGNHSDLDIALITSNEDKEVGRVVNSVKRLSSLEIHSLEFTYKELMEMLVSKGMNIGKEIVKRHIIFKGCEQFYNCLVLSE